MSTKRTTALGASAAATSSAYLTAENALPEAEYTAWEIRVYYAPGQILEGA